MNWGFENTSLWKSSLGIQGDQIIERLRASYITFRGNMKGLLDEVRKDFPNLTDHSIEHVDNLWRIASLITGDDYPINPLEGFVLGCSFMVHDSVLSYKAFGGKDALRGTIEWKDKYQDIVGTEYDTEEGKKRIDFKVIRQLHAKNCGEILSRQFKSLDGNGRIGRLLITLFLVKERILDKPLLYLSTYFEKNKGLYYDNLSNVREKSDMKQWIKYFLVGIEQTAAKSAETLSEILKFKDNTEESIRGAYGRRSTHAIKLLHSLMKNPYTTVEKAANTCSLSYKAANDLVKKMHKDGYLVEITGQSRNRLYVFQSYLDMFE